MFNIFDNKLNTTEPRKEISLNLFDSEVPEYSVNVVCSLSEIKATNIINERIITYNSIDRKVLFYTPHFAKTVESKLLRRVMTFEYSELQNIIDSGFDISLLAIDGMYDLNENHIEKLKQFAHKNKCTVILSYNNYVLTLFSPKC